MIEIKKNQCKLIGPMGSLPVDPHDEITKKLAMIFEGQCEGKIIAALVKKFGYTRQRYYQLLSQFRHSGALALQSRKTGPQAPFRRTREAVRQVIRHLFLDRQASAEVVAQKLRQLGHAISIRSVRRVIAEYGLQKKTPHR